MLCCERLLRAPSPRRVLALAAVLAIQLLPGFMLIDALRRVAIVMNPPCPFLSTLRVNSLASRAVIAVIAVSCYAQDRRLRAKNN